MDAIRIPDGGRCPSIPPDRDQFGAAGTLVGRRPGRLWAVAFLLDEHPAVAVLMSAGQDRSLGVRSHHAHLLSLVGAGRVASRRPGHSHTVSLSARPGISRAPATRTRSRGPEIPLGGLRETRREYPGIPTAGFGGLRLARPGDKSALGPPVVSGAPRCPLGGRTGSCVVRRLATASWRSARRESLLNGTQFYVCPRSVRDRPDSWPRAYRSASVWCCPARAAGHAGRAGPG